MELKLVQIKKCPKQMNGEINNVKIISSAKPVSFHEDQSHTF